MNSNGGSAVVMKESSGNINNYNTPAKNDPQAASAFISTFGKHSLMHRVANSPRPFATVGKSGKMNSTHFPQSMGSTMDATSGHADDIMETTKASPFRETVTKGLITGVGFLNKRENSLGNTN